MVIRLPKFVGTLCRSFAACRNGRDLLISLRQPDDANKRIDVQALFTIGATRPCRELSRFFGIIIRMYMEVGGPHHLPHFHAYHQDDVAVFGLDPVELIADSLPRRQCRLVEAWAELHQAELKAAWHRLQAGRAPLPIDPLR